MSDYEEKPIGAKDHHQVVSGPSTSGSVTPPLGDTTVSVNDIDGSKAKHNYNVDTESLISDTTLIAQQEGLKPAFLAKANILNNAIADIGMGRYQYELFFSGGFGWFADNIWLQAVAIVMQSVSYEWEGYPNVRFATLALYAGLICGATFWGITADIIGRRIAWNSTLFIGGLFGICAGAAPNFIVFCTFVALIGFGVGGNLPVDGTMFLEFMPGSHQWLLTLLSLWWAIGQVVASLISWAFIAKYGCVRDSENPPPTGAAWCTKADNSGWRYTYYTLGAMMLFLWALRIYALPVYESPKFLASVGKDHEAVETIHKLAKRNGKTSTLTVEDLQNAAAPYMDDQDRANQAKYDTKFSVWELIKNSMEDVSGDKLKTLFGTKRLAYSTSLIIFCYGAVGLAYPLYNQFLTGYLSKKGAQLGSGSVNDTYSAYTYQAACGVPGSMAAAYLVTWSRAGRKFSMAFFTAGAGVFLFGLTAARNYPTINALTCIAAFMENAFYGVLFGYAPELFPTPVRGTGDALCASFNRITGFFSPIIAIYSAAATTPDGPVFAAAGIFVATGVIMCFLPVETYGRTAL